MSLNPISSATIRRILGFGGVDGPVVTVVSLLSLFPQLAKAILKASNAHKILGKDPANFEGIKWFI
jgi:hypothetical protein